jgi:2-dehydro-3-deoxyphosphogluconate aldolase/(4S)-4-hydroxy-2-oxoglutarate aldolase
MTSFVPQSGLKDILCRAAVVPVVVIEKLVDAASLARALVAGGLSVIEVTLRTKAALEAIRIIAAEVEGAVVGAGTVLGPHQLEAVRDAGARFAVSPGATDALLNAAGALGVPLLPGIASASEAPRQGTRSSNIPHNPYECQSGTMFLR